MQSNTGGSETLEQEMNSTAGCNEADIHQGSSELEGPGTLGLRCTIRNVHDVISRFNDKKRELVEAIGFGGLLKFPLIRRSNRRFTEWLMGMVDVSTVSIRVPGGFQLHFTKEDITTVFGIPSEGMKIKEANHLSRHEKQLVKMRCWPANSKEQNSIKAVQELIETDYASGMTIEDEDTFKVAFVVFVMSLLFVPGAKHDYACMEYWPALLDPKKIHCFDWAEYVLQKLIAAVSKHQTDNMTSVRPHHITGCYIFLQVFYLDNLDMVGLMTEHKNLPRIAAFDDKQLRKMIAADTVITKVTSKPEQYGKHKMRSKEGCIYTWSRRHSEGCFVRESEVQISLWEAAVRMARVLRIPLEAAGPLYVAIQEINHRMSAPGGHSVVDCINVLLSIMLPYIYGFRYFFGLYPKHKGPTNQQSLCATTEENNADMDQSTLDKAAHEQFPCVCSCRKRKYGSGCPSAGPMHTLPAEKCIDGSVVAADLKEENVCGTAAPVNYTVIEAMSRFYVMIQQMKTYNTIDLNNSSVDSGVCQSKPLMLPTTELQRARSPWEMGGMWDYRTCDERDQCEIEADARILWSSTENIIPFKIAYSPKYIEVLRSAADEQLIGLSEMEMDMYDALMRVFMRTDDVIYGSEGRVRWRHFFESDILNSVLTGWFNVENPSIRNQFIGDHLRYDIYNCTVLFFPGIIQHRWVCFCWHLDKNSIVVYDPACMSIPGTPTRSIYNHVAGLLKLAMATTIPLLFNGWDYDWKGATVNPLQWQCAGLQRNWNRTGVLCAYFARCYNGDRILPDISMGDVDRIAALLIYEMSNHGLGATSTVPSG